ncbi:MAG: aminoacyl--tRNA ligase-related protein [Patescibacteria group bacterium]
MKQSQLFTKVSRQDPKDETALNARLLERGGFVYKNSAGIYSYLPLGWRVMQKIAQIIREEMNAIGGQELFMPALVEKKYLDATGRWSVEVGYEVHGKGEKAANFTLGWTHEEVLTEIVSKYISSYKDLPFAAYQIQTKFRNEPRAKSGLLRGREFMMKDLYSFHASEDDFEKYYEKVADAYRKIFERCGLKAVYTLAGGGAFTAKHTHEFQVPAEVGEDTIFVCEKCEYAENKEISKLQEGDRCPVSLRGSETTAAIPKGHEIASPAARNDGKRCGGRIYENKAIEVGNIFPLGTKYSEAFDLKFRDENGKEHFVVMGSYGIGLGRVMATVVEVSNDKAGIIWPESVAPFRAHLLSLGGADGSSIYEKLQKAGIEVLYDDRDLSAGEKFAESDLLGIPWRLVVSPKTGDGVEVKRRNEGKSKTVSVTEALKLLK